MHPRLNSVRRCVPERSRAFAAPDRPQAQRVSDHLGRVRGPMEGGGHSSANVWRPQASHGPQERSPPTMAPERQRRPPPPAPTQTARPSALSDQDRTPNATPNQLTPRRHRLAPLPGRLEGSPSGPVRSCAFVSVPDGFVVCGLMTTRSNRPVPTAVVFGISDGAGTTTVAVPAGQLGPGRPRRLG